MSDDVPKKSKKILGPIEKVMLIASLALLGYLAFSRGGFKMSEKTEEVTITDNPHAHDWQKKKRKVKQGDAESASVDAVLAELADQFSRGDESGLGSTNADQFSRDEADFMKDIQDKYKLDESVKNARDWFAVLKASHNTYSKVKSLFEDLNSTSVKDDKVDEVLNDQRQSEQLKYKLQDWFDIPREDIEAFAKSGKRALSDWAEFVEDHQKEQ